MGCYGTACSPSARWLLPPEAPRVPRRVRRLSAPPALALLLYQAPRRTGAEHAIPRHNGGGQPLLSIDATDADGRCPLEPRHDTTPERLYERTWAITLLERALLKLRAEYVKRGQETLFEKIKPCLVGGSGELHRVIAEELGMREKTFNTSVSRCQRRFNKLIKDEIAETVGGEGELEDEMRYLLSVLRSH